MAKLLSLDEIADMKRVAQVLADKAKTLETEANQLFLDAYLAEMAHKPLESRLIVSPHHRCWCGAPMANDPVSRKQCWECCDVLTNQIEPGSFHAPSVPFARKLYQKPEC